MNVDDFERLEDISNINIIIFELNEDKTLSQLYVSKNIYQEKDIN